MTDEELREALDGLCAYDEGATGSGIHDEALRARCREELKERQALPHAWRGFISRLVRDMHLTDEMIEEGYGLYDALDFIRWLDERMGITL